MAHGGAKRAVMALAPCTAEMACPMLKPKRDYRELRVDHFDRIEVNRTR
jgi:hypothetical protein